ncbi:MAG: hypothetical protein GX644_03965 [Limnobacter sp.]|nr:hypothetical protein [Limnobacter sp.]
MAFERWPWPAAWLATALAVLLVYDAVRRAAWRGSRRDLSIWLMATLMVLVARQMTVTLSSGLTLQYLGAAWLGLLLGYPRAVVSLAAIYLFETLITGRNPALPLLLLGIAPAWLIWFVASACRRWLPPNLFVFLLGPGFLGLFACYVLPLVFAAALGTLFAGAPAGQGYWQTMLPYAVLLSAGETWLEGMMTTLLVVFVPDAVKLFDEGYYLRKP